VWPSTILRLKKGGISHINAARQYLLLKGEMKARKKFADLAIPYDGGGDIRGKVPSRNLVAKICR